MNSERKNLEVLFDVLCLLIPSLIVMSLFTEINIYQKLSEPAWLTLINNNVIITSILVYMLSCGIYYALFFKRNKTIIKL